MLDSTMQPRLIRQLWLASVLTGSVLLTACGGGTTVASAPVADTPVAAPAPLPAPAPVATAATCPATFTPLTQPEVDEALFMREEEKLARDVYLDLAAFWRAQAGDVPVVKIMNNIALNAEQSHMDAMAGVLTCYGLTDPIDSAQTHGVFLNTELASLYQTLMTRGQKSQLDALYVGGFIEEADMEDLQKSIDLSQQAYTDSVYASLMCGSRNHLRSFVAQIKAVSGGYTAQVLTQAAVDSIVSSPSENCGAGF